MPTYSIQWTPSDKQIQIIRLVCEGLTNGEIAARMSIPERSMSNQVSTIYHHLGLSEELGANSPGTCRVKLFRWAIKNKVVTV